MTAATGSPPGTTRLKVPYEWQHDNASGQGFRECFTSSCAMLAHFWGKTPGDDAYAKVRAGFGDTTDAVAQVAALHTMGLDARFRSDGTPELICAEIAAGRPVAVGWIHKGPLLTGLRGGGHWSVVSGFTPTHVVMEDPNGEADLVNGGYLNLTGGRSVLYSWRNWVPRWSVIETASGFTQAPGHGWMVTVKPW